MASIKLVFGGAAINLDFGFHTPDQLRDLFATLKQHGVDVIDTAQRYARGGSETALGRAKAGQQFTIDTKAFGGFEPGSSTRDKLVAEGKQSIKRLAIDQVDIFYLHSPDHAVPLSDSLAGIDELHKLGLFKRFGLSNFKADDVRNVYDHCKAHSYILPTVYQGNYSAVARLQETLLLPLLRELGIAFYAYSPIAGGFLAKSKQEILVGKGRFESSHPMSKVYMGLYAKPSYLDALDEWGDIAENLGIHRAELAYRWVAYNSQLDNRLGDAAVFGGRYIDQVRETLEGISRGPLPEDAVKRIDRIWDTIKHEAPLDNFNSVPA